MRGNENSACLFRCAQQQCGDRGHAGRCAPPTVSVPARGNAPLQVNAKDRGEKLGLAQEELVDPRARRLSESCFGLLGDHGALAARPVDMANSEGVEDVFVLMSTLLHHFASLPMVERPHKQNGAEASIVLV